MAVRYERFDDSDRWVTFLSEDLKEVQDYDPEKGPRTNFGHNLESYVRLFCGLTVSYYLLDDVENTKCWARRTLVEAERYFFGDWRQSMPGSNPEYWAKGGGLWMRAYRSAMAFGSALGDERALKRLSEFPHSPYDVTDWKSETVWYLLLAEYFARGVTKKYEERLAEILDGTAKWLRMLAGTLDAIVRDRRDEVPARFAEHFGYYLKTVRKRFEPEFQLDLDGTILYHLAARLGRPFDIDDKTRDHLIILE